MSSQVTLKQHIDLQALLEAFPKEFLHITPQHQKMTIALYRLLAEGKAVSRQQLATKAKEWARNNFPVWRPDWVCIRSF